MRTAAPLPARTRPAWRRGAALCLGALALGCASEIDRRFPELAAIGGHRLGDAHPYLLPAGDALYEFLCRWSERRAVSVSLPPDATPDERVVLEAALTAWERAGLGLRFERRDGPPADVEMRFVGAEPETRARRTRSGSTVVDCAVSPVALAGVERGALPARLVRAWVHLSRANLDFRGVAVPLSREELAGAALHELGHALGYQGHALRRSTVMVAEFDEVRRAGAKLLAGARFDDPSLRALYALPSGALLRRSALSAENAQLARRVSAAARRAELRGPFAQVGDHSARLVWRDARGADYALVVVNLSRALRDPRELVLLPNANARRALAGDATP